MRVLLAVAFVIVTAVAAFTYRDLLLRPARAARARPARPILVRPAAPLVRQVAAAAIVPTAAPGPDALAMAVVDSIVNSLMLVVQENPTDVRAMTDLAFLYMRHGWFDRAIRPLARAREIDPSSEPLRRYLELALARTGGPTLDLAQAAQEFAEMAADWGMGC